MNKRARNTYDIRKAMGLGPDVVLQVNHLSNDALADLSDICRKWQRNLMVSLYGGIGIVKLSVGVGLMTNQWTTVAISAGIGMATAIGGTTMGMRKIEKATSGIEFSFKS